MEDGATITQEICLPSYEQITRHIMTVAEKTGIHHVFVASDVEPRLSYIKKKLGIEVSVCQGLQWASPNTGVMCIPKN